MPAAPGQGLVGHAVAESLPEVADQGFVELLDRVYATGEPFRGKKLFVRLDPHGNGELTDAHFNFTYQLFEEGDQKAGITVFAFDVTDLVLARNGLEVPRDNEEPATR
ncbi:hypothetical protein [Hymenobacter cellulosivorans]|uniref:Uncharacterized protein n=1 Tax=Hymenobacter cellulosivorans TaxID=2932249 RepID=A0ABY4F9D9_9BACT|nr:hypothetical protein [Hymenobacter cellulosivorans]UOQ52559.1 hypothetical protein MUN80_22755 [Hymenobacter cellulosivorans]